MSNDNDDEFEQPVTSRSDAEVEASGNVCHEASGIREPGANVIDKIMAAAPKFRASLGLSIIPVADEFLPDRAAEATLNPPTITVRQSVYNAAKRNEPRARMTLAHEFGHIILEHKGHARPRRDAPLKRHVAFKAYEDPERQATLFAGAFLVPKSQLKEPASAKEIQLRFRISAQAATIRYEQIFGARGKNIPSDVKAEIHAMKANVAKPVRPTSAQREAEVETRIKRMWDRLETIPGKDPAMFRKAGSFEVRWTDRYQPRSHNGWCVHRDRIRNYLDLESQ